MQSWSKFSHIENQSVVVLFATIKWEEKNFKKWLNFFTPAKIAKNNYDNRVHVGTFSKL